MTIILATGLACGLAIYIVTLLCKLFCIRGQKLRILRDREKKIRKDYRSEKDEQHILSKLLVSCSERWEIGCSPAAGRYWA